MDPSWPPPTINSDLRASFGRTVCPHSALMPLARGQALGECAGAANKERLLSLLVTVQRASKTCPWLKDTVAAGEIPASASAADHASVCAERPRLTATVGAKPPSAANPPSSGRWSLHGCEQAINPPQCDG
jgi:hypothetical protein